MNQENQQEHEEQSKIDEDQKEKIIYCSECGKKLIRKKSDCQEFNRYTGKQYIYWWKSCPDYGNNTMNLFHKIIGNSNALNHTQELLKK